MIYLKFNNKDYNQLKLGDKNYRFSSGFFIDREHFEDAAFKKHDNIMKSFPFIDYVECNTNLFHSFCKYSKGRLEDSKFSSNNDSGRPPNIF